VRSRDALARVDRGGGRGGVAGIQRARLVAGMVEVVRERGVGQVTVAHIVARSGVSRRTFYELFEDREACFLAAFDEAVQRAAGCVLPAFEGAGGGWCGRVRAGLGALLGFLDDEPGLGALCIVDGLGAGPRVLERRAEVVRVLVDVVDGGREGAKRTKGGLGLTRLTAEGVVGAVLGVLHARIAAGDARSMVGLLGPLMGMVLLPYRGAGVAAREVSRPAPRRRRVVSHAGDPLRDLDMRLTYRTVRVLLAIAERPGASNRVVAQGSGVQDQGQISKLLARLEHLGLISNEGVGASRGEPNAWRLTPRGREIEHTIRQQTPDPTTRATI
jgi:AcrR family transcriptional regulator